jgi:hypothetical protein
MRLRLLVLGAAVLLVLGVAVGVWAAVGDEEPDCVVKTITLEDPSTQKLMEYHQRDC